jgi:glycine cleavage system T protein (aminomethyltransferase)
MATAGTSVEVKKTPLHATHVALGARMIDFGGWDMPVQYSGILEEHRAVRERAGLFDVSHMGEIAVEGRDALAYLQSVTPNDVARLGDGRCHYSAFLTEAGTFVDDLLVYRFSGQRFLLVVNASNAPKDFAWARSYAAEFDVDVRNTSAEWAQLALQGPRAQAILSLKTPADLASISYYAFVEAEVSGAPAIVSRTGYTGEDGFEIYCASSEGPRLFEEILEAGRGEGILPCGLGARDTLRLEAKMCLYGNDIDDSTTAYEADLGWIVKPGKGQFLGREALVRQRETGLTRKLVGFEVTGRGIARHGYEARTSIGPGQVTSGTMSPTLGRAIGLAYLPLAATAVGTDFGVDIRGRETAARVVATPFYKRSR